MRGTNGSGDRRRIMKLQHLPFLQNLITSDHDHEARLSGWNAGVEKKNGKPEKPCSTPR